jgi:hypothetical protein
MTVKDLQRVCVIKVTILHINATLTVSQFFTTCGVRYDGN